jgi:cytoskeleton protein RodZ
MTVRGSGLIASICGAIILFGIASWMFSPSLDLSGSKEPERVAASEPAETPEVQAPAPDERREGTVASITSVTETPLPDAPAREVPAPTETVQDSPESLDGLAALIEQEVASEARAAEGQAIQSQTEGGKVYGAENQDVRLVLKAKAPVWIRIEDGKGNVVLTQTLMAGDSYRVPNQEGLVIIARDGGLLGVEIDGSPKGTLGQPGEILVGRTLDIAKLAQKG